MAERLKEIVYTLEVPFDYTLKGQVATASFVSLSPPTAKNRHECAELEQAFMRALPDTKDAPEAKASSGESDDPTGAETLALIAMSSDSSLADVLETARKLFISGVAKIEGETTFKSDVLDRVDLDDFKEMAGQYLVGFILRSALGSQKKS